MCPRRLADHSTTRVARAAHIAVWAFLYAGHVRQLGGEGPPPDMVDVKGWRTAGACDREMGSEGSLGQGRRRTNRNRKGARR